MQRLLCSSAVLVITLVFAACSGEEDPVVPATTEVGPLTAAAQRAQASPQMRGAGDAATVETALIDLAARWERELRTLRPNVAAHSVFWTGDANAGAVGGEIFFNDRGNKRLGIEWVPGDPRRNGRNDIGYAYGDLFDPNIELAPAGLTVAEVEAAVDRAMATWDGQTCSSTVSMPKGTFFDWLVFDSDILHAGFTSLPPDIIGVTISFAFLEFPSFEPSDIDGNGADDYAFAVILYNSLFPWAIDGNVDVETIALHEAGHGLGQAHFGKAFETAQNGQVHFAPLALMNAGYSGVRQELTGTDQAGHCGLYGAWPAG